MLALAPRCGARAAKGSAYVGDSLPPACPERDNFLNQRHNRLILLASPRGFEPLLPP
jgi:hypothetical protein